MYNALLFARDVVRTLVCKIATIKKIRDFDPGPKIQRKFCPTGLKTTTINIEQHRQVASAELGITGNIGHIAIVGQPNVQEKAVLRRIRVGVLIELHTAASFNIQAGIALQQRNGVEIIRGLSRLPAHRRVSVAYAKVRIGGLRRMRVDDDEKTHSRKDAMRMHH
jgi:hypothetical protein